MRSTSSNNKEHRKETSVQAQTVLRSFPSAAGRSEMGYSKLKLWYWSLPILQGQGLGFGFVVWLFFFNKPALFFSYFHFKTILQKLPISGPIWNTTNEGITKCLNSLFMYLISSCLFECTPLTQVYKLKLTEYTIVLCTFGILHQCSKVPLQNPWQGRKFCIILALNIWKN